MRFTLNRELLTKNMISTGSVIHHTGNTIRMFPFVANAKEIADSKQDLKSFKGIAGACFRECLQFSHDSSFDRGLFIENVCATANAAGNTDLKDIVEKLAFDEGGAIGAF